VGYSRYIDELNEPLFPFGYGLSYTSFTISAPRLSATRLFAHEITPSDIATLAAEVDITNTGARSGADVVQLYLCRTGTSISEPSRELHGFQRVTLKPGETRHLHFILGFNDFAVTTADTQAMETMHVDIFAGDDSLAMAKTAIDIAP
jgi:beta-glucosidase